jgi:hypothetical protein
VADLLAIATGVHVQIGVDKFVRSYDLFIMIIDQNKLTFLAWLDADTRSEDHQIANFWIKQSPTQSNHTRPWTVAISTSNMTILFLRSAIVRKVRLKKLADYTKDIFNRSVAVNGREIPRFG